MALGMRNKVHSLEEYTNVMDLRKKGWGATRISNFLFKEGTDINPRTISGWLYRCKNPKGNRNTILPFSNFLSEDKAYILGVLCGDGYLKIDNVKNIYLIGLDVCDEDFADNFKSRIKEVYGLNTSKLVRQRMETNYSKTPKPIYSTYICSKSLIHDLLTYSPSFKSKLWQVPIQIINSNLNIKSSFLKGLFDSEGSIRLRNKGNAQLGICSGNVNSLLVVNNLLKNDFCINMKVYIRKDGMCILETWNYKDIKNFEEKIGFSIKRKNDTLISALNSYNRKGLRKYSREFKLNVLRLLDEGYSAYTIGKLLNFPHTNVYDFVKSGVRDEE